MAAPNDLSLKEIRIFMLEKGGKVTNHELVKHFKLFLTNPVTKGESRKRFKTYVNILSTIKNEQDEKYLILRKKYFTECPNEEIVASHLNEKSATKSNAFDNDSINSENSMESVSAMKPPPPYKLPPNVSHNKNYRMCVDEFKFALNSVDNNDSFANEKPLDVISEYTPEENREENVKNVKNVDNAENVENDSGGDNKMSVREATKKFNRFASQEDTIKSPVNNNKKTGGQNVMEDITNTNMITNHQKSREWLVSASRSNYQELAKLSSEYPELVHLQDTTTTALHWAAKNGNENVVKLIAGVHKTNVNARTNGGYSALHLSVQFERDNIYDLLVSVYKADPEVLDWSGKKPSEYRKPSTNISTSTFNRIKSRKKQFEKDMKFLRIGSLNVRVKKTTEAFSNFLGVGSTTALLNQREPQANYGSETRDNSSNIYKNWGSADNVSQESDIATMPPPKASTGKKRPKRSTDLNNSAGGYRSMPTTPNQERSKSYIANSHQNEESDSDTACGFDNTWKQPSQ